MLTHGANKLKVESRNGSGQVRHKPELFAHTDFGHVKAKLC